MATTPRKKLAHNRASSRDVKTFFQQQTSSAQERKRDTFVLTAGTTIWLSTGRLEFHPGVDETNEPKKQYLALLEQLHSSDSDSDQDNEANYWDRSWVEDENEAANKRIWEQQEASRYQKFLAQQEQRATLDLLEEEIYEAETALAMATIESILREQAQEREKKKIWKVKRRPNSSFGDGVSSVPITEAMVWSGEGDLASSQQQQNQNSQPHQQQQNAGGLPQPPHSPVGQTDLERETERQKKNFFHSLKPSLTSFLEERRGRSSTSPMPLPPRRTASEKTVVAAGAAGTSNSGSNVTFAPKKSPTDRAHISFSSGLLSVRSSEDMSDWELNPPVAHKRISPRTDTNEEDMSEYDDEDVEEEDDEEDENPNNMNNADYFDEEDPGSSSLLSTNLSTDDSSLGFYSSGDEKEGTAGSSSDLESPHTPSGEGDRERKGITWSKRGQSSSSPPAAGDWGAENEGLEENGGVNIASSGSSHPISRGRISRRDRRTSLSKGAKSTGGGTRRKPSVGSDKERPASSSGKDKDKGKEQPGFKLSPLLSLGGRQIFDRFGGGGGSAKDLGASDSLTVPTGAESPNVRRMSADEADRTSLLRALSDSSAGEARTDDSAELPSQRHRLSAGSDMEAPPLSASASGLSSTSPARTGLVKKGVRRAGTEKGRVKKKRGSLSVLREDPKATSSASSSPQQRPPLQPTHGQIFRASSPKGSGSPSVSPRSESETNGNNVPPPPPALSPKRDAGGTQSESKSPPVSPSPPPPLNPKMKDALLEEIKIKGKESHGRAKYKKKKEQQRSALMEEIRKKKKKKPPTKEPSPAVSPRGSALTSSSEGTCPSPIDPQRRALLEEIKKKKKKKTSKQGKGKATTTTTKKKTPGSPESTDRGSAVHPEKHSSKKPKKQKDRQASSSTEEEDLLATSSESIATRNSGGESSSPRVGAGVRSPRSTDGASAVDKGAHLQHPTRESPRGMQGENRKGVSSTAKEEDDDDEEEEGSVAHYATNPIDVQESHAGDVAAGMLDGGEGGDREKREYAASANNYNYNAEDGPSPYGAVALFRSSSAEWPPSSGAVYSPVLDRQALMGSPGPKGRTEKIQTFLERQQEDLNKQPTRTFDATEKSLFEESATAINCKNYEAHMWRKDRCRNCGRPPGAHT